MRSIPAALALPLLLAACGSSEPTAKEGATATADADGASVDIDVGGPDGGVSIKTAKDSRDVAIKVGGTEIKTTLPEFLDQKVTKDFQIAGVQLPTGSVIDGIKVRADTKSNADGSATVNVSFDTPMTPAAAADWLRREFAQKKVAITTNGTTLTGRDGDGTFTIDLAPGADGKGSAGQVRIVETR